MYIYVNVLGVSMKEVQEWLGHSDYATTANIYSHLEYNSKVSSAQAMRGTKAQIKKLTRECL